MAARVSQVTLSGATENLHERFDHLDADTRMHRDRVKFSRRHRADVARK